MNRSKTGAHPTRYIILAILTLVLNGSWSVELNGQESSSEQDKQNIQEIVVAIHNLVSQGNLVLQGSVKSEAPESMEAEGTHVGGRAKPFEGEIEVHFTVDGELVAVSNSSVPGIEIYDDGERALVRTAFHLDETYSADRLLGELGVVLSIENIQKSLGSCKNIVRQQEDGHVSYKCPLTKRFLKDAPGAHPMQPIPLRVFAEFEIADGKLSSYALTIVESDPFGAAKERQNSVEPKEKGSGFKLQTFRTDDADHSREGKHWKYRFSVSNDKPSDRLLGFLKDVRSANSGASEK